MMRFLTFLASVQTGTLPGEMSWAKTEFTRLNKGHHFVSRKRFEASTYVERVLFILAKSTVNISSVCSK